MVMAAADPSPAAVGTWAPGVGGRSRRPGRRGCRRRRWGRPGPSRCLSRCIRDRRGGCRWGRHGADALRFTGEEVSSYLNDLNNLDLTTADLAALDIRTEGWVAALQLAALSLRNRTDHADRTASSPGLLATTDSSSTTSSRRSSAASLTTYAASCSTPRSSIGSPVRCATRSAPCLSALAPRTAKRCSRPWTGRTCSWSRSTTTGAGTATTTSSETSCTPTCSTNGPKTSQPPSASRRLVCRGRAHRSRGPARAGRRGHGAGS